MDMAASKTEYKILSHFLNNADYMSSRTIAEVLTLDLTTAQRAVKKLFEQKIVSRMQENLENGGYIFRYKISGKENINALISEILNNWVTNVQVELKNWRP